MLWLLSQMGVTPHVTDNCIYILKFQRLCWKTSQWDCELWSFIYIIIKYIILIWHFCHWPFCVIFLWSRKDYSHDFGYIKNKNNWAVFIYFQRQWAGGVLLSTFTTVFGFEQNTKEPKFWLFMEFDFEPEIENYGLHSRTLFIV